MTDTKPYGSWPSDITAADLTTAAPRFDGAQFVNGEVWWAESVPAEKGRTAVFREGSAEVLLPAPWNARSKVHEYGGGAWAATSDGTIAFVEATTQRLYKLRPGSEPIPLTPLDESTRFGGLVSSAGRLLAVRERHTGAKVPLRDIVDVPLDASAAEKPGAIRSLASGTDFVAQPRLNPAGTHLAWIGWNHPDMPWDAAALRVGALTPQGVTESVLLSQAAATQVEWISDAELLFSDDPSGRWNLFRGSVQGEVAAFSPADADTGGPLWNLGSRWFAPLDDARVVAVRTNGTDELALIDMGGSVHVVDIPLTGSLQIADVRGTELLLFGESATNPSGLWRMNLDDPSTLTPVRGGVATWDAAWLPLPKQVTVESPRGEVHAFAYPPTNPNFTAPDSELAPYVALVHGGPTAHVSGGFAAWIAYLTSRGIGVLDVNYGGSTGYGRAYRERLKGNWGIVDVEDVALAMQGLADAGIADPKRLAVRGGSAGGLTVLGSLVRGTPFSAGISRYGVADLRLLAADTHDFESRYLDGLIGPYPEAEQVYIERSPLTHVEQISAPVLIQQGSDDAVVPPSQSEAVRDALASQGVPHKYVLFEGEGHGFRQASTIVDAAEQEISFLGAVFGFTPSGVELMQLDTAPVN